MEAIAYYIVSAHLVSLISSANLSEMTYNQSSFTTD